MLEKGNDMNLNEKDLMNDSQRKRSTHLISIKLLILLASLERHTREWRDIIWSPLGWTRAFHTSLKIFLDLLGAKVPLRALVAFFHTSLLIDGPVAMDA